MIASSKKYTPPFSGFKFYLISVLAIVTAMAAHSQPRSVANTLQAPAMLTCNLMSDDIGQPVHISNRQPAFGWAMMDNKSNVKQLAYEILVADQADLIKAGKFNVWQSGKIASSKSAGIVYGGKALLPDKDYFWAVRVWNNFNEVSPYSRPILFHTSNELTDYATERKLLVKTEQFPVRVKYADKAIVADFGKDAFGQLKLRLLSDRNDSITIRLGEITNADGFINRKPPGTIRYSEYRLGLREGLYTYNLNIRADKRNTGPDAIKMPGYIGEVTPFRYVEIAGYNRTLKQTDIVRMAVNYPFNEEAASFHSSDSILNQVWDLCKYSVKATSFAGVYVDGDRERIPYEADALINQLSHYAVDNEYSLARYSHEYLITKPTWPTEWILQSVLIAWNDYLYTGDIRSVQHFYDDLTAKTLKDLQDSSGLITVKKVNPEVLKKIHFNTARPLEDIVDWPHTGILGLGKNEGGETDGFVFTPYNAVSNAYCYRALTIMQKLATDLGKQKDAAMFASKASALKKAYQKMLWDDKRKIYCDGVSTRHASMHTNVFALLYGLVDEKDKAGVVSFIQSRGMACSVYGSQFLLDALYDSGGSQYGLSLLTSTTDRSWYNMIRVGSTITLEAWDNKYKPNQDWNHVWGAAPANIISRKLMGIEPLEPGWSQFMIAPKPANLKQAQISVPTVRGTILMEYKQAGRQFDMKVEIPANSVAQVYLPVIEKDMALVTMDGKKIATVRKEKSYYIKNVGSGSHTFRLQ